MMQFPFQLGGVSQALFDRDFNYNNVSLLLHCDGLNNSTTFTDSSKTPKTVTANGNAKISTAQSKFGGASGLFDGTGDYLSVATGMALGTGDFTVEAHCYFTSLGDINPIASSRLTLGSSTLLWMLYAESDGSVKLQTRTGGAGTQYFAISAAGSVAINTMYHIAGSRTSGVLRVFVDGVVGGTTANDGSFNITEASLAVGLFNFTGFIRYIAGYIDDFRLTTGVSRYTANFTPPAAPFSNY